MGFGVAADDGRKRAVRPTGAEASRVLLSCHEQMLGERPLAEKLAAIREAGFDGVDLGWATIADGSAAGLLAEGGLPVGAVYAQIRGAGLLGATAAERAAAVDAAVARAEGAAALGAATMVLVPIFREARLRGFPGLVEVEELETAILLAALDEIARRVADLPLTIALEPLNGEETHFLTDPARGAVLCEAIGSPRLATMVDTYHCHLNGQDVPAQIAAAGERLALVHLSDSDRTLPGEGTIDFAGALAALRRRGYAGWMGYECRGATDPAALARSVGLMRRLWDEAA